LEQRLADLKPHNIMLERPRLRSGDGHHTARVGRPLLMDFGLGIRHIDEGRAFDSLIWFTESLAHESDDPVSEEMHRIRIATVLRHAPKLTQMFFHEGAVYHVEFSRDGRRVVTASNDGMALVWDVETGHRVASTRRHQAAVRHATFSPDGRSVATASADGIAQVWNTESGEPLGEPIRRKKGQEKGVRSLFGGLSASGPSRRSTAEQALTFRRLLA
jgi:WD40 repeat protein